MSMADRELDALIKHAVAAERERCAKIAELAADNSDSASYTYDGGSGSMGYESACRDIAETIRKD